MTLDDSQLAVVVGTGADVGYGVGDGGGRGDGAAVAELLQ